MKSILTAALCSLALSAPALSQSAEQVALAERLAEQTGASDMAMQMIEVMAPSIRQQMQAADPSLSEAQLDRITEILVEEFRAAQPQLHEGIVDLYARSFSVEEMQAASDFYATPMGRAFIDRMPQVTQESAILGQTWGQQVAMRALPRVQAYILEESAE